ncbi:ACT domain-containing protein [Bacteroides cellulosilyticus]|nr:ACT domain-containing protein [Bacteroides cellulosilyticus]
MAGIKDLGTLLSSIDPVLDERSFVFLYFSRIPLG